MNNLGTIPEDMDDVTLDKRREEAEQADKAEAEHLAELDGIEINAGDQD